MKLSADPALWPAEAQEEHRYRSGLLLSDLHAPPYTPSEIADADRRAAPAVRAWWERTQGGNFP